MRNQSMTVHIRKDQATASRATVAMFWRATATNETSQTSFSRNFCKKKLCTLLDLCVSSLRRGHANLLCIVLRGYPRNERNGRRGKRGGSRSMYLDAGADPILISATGVNPGTDRWPDVAHKGPIRSRPSSSAKRRHERRAGASREAAAARIRPVTTHKTNHRWNRRDLRKSRQSM